jgi:glucose/arabinose dehydrogenase
MRGRTVAILVALLALLVVAGVAGAWYFGPLGISPTVHDAKPVPVPSGAVATVASGLEAPWGIAFLPNGSALVTERNSARVLSVTSGGTVREVARLTDVQPGGEGGLLGIAVSPKYSTDQLVYVYYTSATDNRIAQFRLGEQARPIFTGIPKAGNHNGGRIAFGPDGMLYAGTGDAGASTRSQDRGYLGGKILRLTPDGTPAPGNPIPGSPVYSYGHRNVQGLAWDASGQLYASEFGQNRYDEVNRIVPGGNYGWPDVEGIGNDGRYINPVATWTTADASPSGIAIVANTIYMACLRGAKLYRLGTDGKSAQPLLTDEYGRLRAVTLAPDGALWILTSNRDGRGSPTPTDDRILRLSPANLSS